MRIAVTGIPSRIKGAVIGLIRRPRDLVWFIGGSIFAFVFTVSAQYATTATSSDADNCQLALAAQQAMNNRVQMIGMTSTDPSKFFQVGGSNSCIGDFSMANIDLSRLIPDPLGLLASGISDVVDKLKNAAIGAACMVARNSMGNIIGSYNNAVYLVQGAANAPRYMIDSAISQTSAKVMTDASMAWSTSGVNRATTDVLSSVSQARGTVSGGYSLPSTGVTSLTQIQNSAAGFSTAASNLASAKINLDQANSVVASYANNPGGVPAWVTEQQAKAKAAYDSALSTYNTNQSQVTAPAAAASSVTTGGSIF